MDTLQFNTSVNLDESFVNTKLILLNKNNEKYEANISDIDVNFHKKMTNLKWAIELAYQKDSHCQFQLKVLSNKIDSEIEFDVDSIEDTNLNGEGYCDYSITAEFEPSNIKIDYGNYNIFTDDFCPSSLKFEVRLIEQIDQYNFKMTIDNLELSFDD